MFVYKFSLPNLEAIEQQLFIMEKITPLKIMVSQKQLKKKIPFIRNPTESPTGIEVMNDLIGIGSPYTDPVCRSTLQARDLVHDCTKCIFFNEAINLYKPSESLKYSPCTLHSSYRTFGSTNSIDDIKLALFRRIRYLKSITSKYRNMLKQGVFYEDGN